MIQRAHYVGTCSIPKTGTLGNAFKSSGFDDPESAEYGAWMFQPDDDPKGAYYVADNDLVFHF